MVLLSVPVSLVEALSIHIVILVHVVIHVSHFVKSVVFCSILLVKLFEAFLTIEMTPGTMFIPVTIILFQKIVVVFVVFQSISDVLLHAVATLHPFFICLFRRTLLTLSTFPFLLPVLIGILIIKV